MFVAFQTQDFCSDRLKSSKKLFKMMFYRIHRQPSGESISKLANFRGQVYLSNRSIEKHFD